MYVFVLLPHNYIFLLLRFALSCSVLKLTELRSFSMDNAQQQQSQNLIDNVAAAVLNQLGYTNNGQGGNINEDLISRITSRVLRQSVTELPRTPQEQLSRQFSGVSSSSSSLDYPLQSQISLTDTALHTPQEQQLNRQVSGASSSSALSCTSASFSRSNSSLSSSTTSTEVYDGTVTPPPRVRRRTSCALDFSELPADDPVRKRRRRKHDPYVALVR